jgi:hypothetical protein
MGCNQGAKEGLMTTRREFVKLAAAAAASAKGLVAESASNTVENTLYRDMRGFNYQPSYGSSGFELWQEFDLTTIDTELTQGKKFFPKVGAIRLWLSWDSYIRNPKLFEQRFDSALQCTARHGLLVMPVLFNRWHDFMLDYGGVYVDHLLLPIDKRRPLFRPYLESVVGNHANDSRIFAWDMCNEPVLQGGSSNWTPDLRAAEYSWLTDVHAVCKELGAKAPLCIGTGGLDDIKSVNSICDILTIHPYFSRYLKGEAGKLNGAIEFDSTEFLNQDLEKLDRIVEFANQVKKPLLASETCWGAFNDEKRVLIIQSTLSELKKRDIGWLAYLLHHSLIADGHRAEFGPMDHAGYMAFIEADGSLRPGHGIFNNF